MDGDEGEADVEEILPAEVGGDRTCNDGDTVRDSCKHKIDDGDSRTTLMDEEKVADSCYDDGLVCTSRETGDDTAAARMSIHSHTFP